MEFGTWERLGVGRRRSHEDEFADVEGGGGVEVEDELGSDVPR